MHVVAICIKIAKFIHPPRDGVGVHGCIAHLIVSKVATFQKRARCVGWTPAWTCFSSAVTQIEHLQSQIIMQQDGALLHWCLLVLAYLNEKFPTRWIGREGLLSWPPHSPDTTPLEFFMWGYVKSIIYQPSVWWLKKHTADAIMATRVYRLLRSRQELEYWVDVVHANKLVQTEVYLGQLKSLWIWLQATAKCMCLAEVL